MIDNLGELRELFIEGSLPYREMGEPLVEPVKVPAGLTLQQLTINPVKSAIDPLAATIDNSSVTYVYADASGQPHP